MKVLQVNSVYKKGSTGKITYDIHTELLKHGIESVICYGRGEKIEEPDVYKTCSEFYSYINHFFANLTGVMYGGCCLSTNRLISIIKRENPDIVHLQCINGYFVNIYKLVEWLKKNHIKTVLTLHAEFMYTGGCGHSLECTQWSTPNGCGHFRKCPRYRSEFHSYFDRSSVMWKRMKNAFDGFDDDLIVTSVSPWLMERAKQSPILEGKKHCVVFNGLDTNIFHTYSEKEKNKIKKQLGLVDKKVVFHATPNFNNDLEHIKGGHYVIQLAKRMPEIAFVVAGPKNGDFEIPENLILLGSVKEQKSLAKLYSMADVTLLTSQRETFSMVIAESLCCGTPVVGFKAGGPETIAIHAYSRFEEYGNIDSLQKNLCTVIEQRKNGSMISQQASIYSKNSMGINLVNVYKELLEAWE